MTSDDLWPWFMIFGCMNIWRFPYYIDKPSLVPIRLPTFQMRPLSHFLTTWLHQMNFDLDMWPLTSLTNEASHVASITQLWLKSINVEGITKCLLVSTTTDINDRQQYTTTMVKAIPMRLSCRWHKKQCRPDPLYSYYQSLWLLADKLITTKLHSHFCCPFSAYWNPIYIN